MTVLSIIFGIFMIIGGFSCMFTPLLTFISAEYLVVILVTVFGVIGIIRGIADKRFGINFFFSILSVVFGIVALCLPQFFVLTSGILIYLLACWFVMQGIVSIYTSIALTRTLGTKMWILQLIVGILVVLLGGYIFVHPMLFAASIASTLGFLLGFCFVVTGFTLLFAPASKSE